MTDLSPSEREAMERGYPKDHAGHYEMGWFAARDYYEERCKELERERDELAEQARISRLAVGTLRERVEEWQERCKRLEEALSKISEGCRSGDDPLSLSEINWMVRAALTEQPEKP
jgi:predicted nuclease with TOPRIM domain